MVSYGQSATDGATATKGEVVLGVLLLVQWCSGAPVVQYHLQLLGSYDSYT